MKKILSLLAIVAALSFVACNNEKKENKTGDTKTETPAKMDETKPAEMMAEKEHVCTDKCKDGNHVYAHGEKGHTCTEECKKMNM